MRDKRSAVARWLTHRVGVIRGFSSLTHRRQADESLSSTRRQPLRVVPSAPSLVLRKCIRDPRSTIIAAAPDGCSRNVEQFRGGGPWIPPLTARRCGVGTLDVEQDVRRQRSRYISCVPWLPGRLTVKAHRRRADIVWYQSVRLNINTIHRARIRTSPQRQGC